MTTPAPHIRDWFSRPRFGLFLHWGLYAINGWHEQEQWRGRVERSEYAKLAKKWNPTKFCPDQWLDLAQDAGMEYVVLTTKHHDGFCLFDSKQTDFTTMNTPYGKDVLAQLTEACHKRDIPLGLYYSVVDWKQPNYPNQSRHHEIPAQPEDSPDLEKYIDFMKNQIRELCGNYGPIKLFWWDMNVDRHQDPSVNDLIRQLQPGCIINNRGMDDGDFGTPEREWAEENAIAGRPVEACQSVGTQSWGYRTDESYYSDRHIIRSMDKFMASGAHYLLNVGPRPDGAIPEKSAAMLRRIGCWYKSIRPAFCGTRQKNAFTAINGAIARQDGNLLYLHLPADVMGEDLVLNPLKALPRRAILLNTGDELPCKNDALPSLHAQEISALRVCGLPLAALADTCAVLALEFESGKDLAPLSQTQKEADRRLTM